MDLQNCKRVGTTVHLFCLNHLKFRVRPQFGQFTAASKIILQSSCSVANSLWTTYPMKKDGVESLNYLPWSQRLRNMLFNCGGRVQIVIPDAQSPRPLLLATHDTARRPVLQIPLVMKELRQTDARNFFIQMVLGSTGLPCYVVEKPRSKHIDIALSLQ